jgi:hypothetical protein
MPEVVIRDLHVKIPAAKGAPLGSDGYDFSAQRGGIDAPCETKSLVDLSDVPPSVRACSHWLTESIERNLIRGVSSSLHVV